MTNATSERTPAQLPPFPPHLFALILQYLLPPTPPIPTHLLSNFLLQRHYFLDINPSDDPDLYFLFPAPGKKSSDVIHELERLAGSETTPSDHKELMVEYVAEEGSAVQARVGLGEKLLVIFSLDARGNSLEGAAPTDPVEEAQPEWRYHDVIWKTDKIPAGHPDIPTALSALQKEATSTRNANRTGEEGGEEDDDSPEAQQKRAEDFWSGWSSPSDNSPAVERKPLSSEDSEASYFARYNDVIPVIPDSSLASTRPSTAGEPLAASQISELLDSSQLPIIPTEGYNTPAALSSHKSSLRAFDPPSGLQATTDSAIGRTPTIPRRTPLLGGSPILVPRVDVEAEALGTADAAVADIIRGAWTLWNANHISADQSSSEKRKAEFVRLIERTVSSLP